MLHLPTKFYIKRARSQCIDVNAIRKFATIKDDRLEEVVRTASSCMDKIDNHEAFRGPSVGRVPMHVQYHVSCTTALVPQGEAAPIVEIH
jgi:hypothetical protein